MTDLLTDEEMEDLVAVAERSVWETVIHRRQWRPALGSCRPALRHPGAAFVSLHREGQLAGCIGSLAAVDPLVLTVADRAQAAATNDPRFRAVEPRDLARLDVEVSVLTPSLPMPVAGYDELLATVQPGLDGITVQCGGRRATLLPSVWAQLTSPDDFLAALWRKAGLVPGRWPEGTRVEHYRAQTKGHLGRGVREPQE